MNIRRLQGWALILSGVIGLAVFIGSDSVILKILSLVGTLLLILGVPAIHSAQPEGTLGWIGIFLIELAAVIALVLSLMSMAGSSGLGDAVPLVSAVAGALGRILVGWLTSRKKVFAPWAGWAFILEGVLNFIGGLISSGQLASVLSIVVPIAGAVALVGYGLGLIRQQG